MGKNKVNKTNNLKRKVTGGKGNESNVKQRKVTAVDPATPVHGNEGKQTVRKSLRKFKPTFKLKELIKGTQNNYSYNK